MRLRHMLESAKEAISFVQNQTRESLDKNRMLSLSLVRLIEIVGEAATQVTRAYQSQHSEIPWPQIVGMRNRLIHAYFDIDMDRVWKIVKDDLPPLIVKLEKIVT